MQRVTRFADGGDVQPGTLGPLLALDEVYIAHMRNLLVRLLLLTVLLSVAACDIGGSSVNNGYQQVSNGIGNP